MNFLILSQLLIDPRDHRLIEKNSLATVLSAGDSICFTKITGINEGSKSLLKINIYRRGTQLSFVTNYAEFPIYSTLYTELPSSDFKVTEITSVEYNDDENAFITKLLGNLFPRCREIKWKKVNTRSNSSNDSETIEIAITELVVI